MRESIGGTMIFWIVLFLFSIFITFTAFIIKYARVYKIKNTVINYIIKKDGAVTHNDIDLKLIDMNYQEDGSYKICRYFPSISSEYYYLELYSETGLPIVGSWISFKTKIKGETKSLKVDNDNVDTHSDGAWFNKNEDQCFICVFSKSNSTQGVVGGSKCDTTPVE